MAGPQVLQNTGEELLARLPEDVRDDAETVLRRTNTLDTDSEERTILIRLMEHMVEHIPSENLSLAIYYLSYPLENTMRSLETLEPGLMHLIENMGDLSVRSSTIFITLRNLFENQDFDSSDFTPEFVDGFLTVVRRLGENYHQNEISVVDHYDSWTDHVFRTIMANPNISTDMLTENLADGIFAFGQAINAVVDQDSEDEHQTRVVNALIRVMGSRYFNLDEVIVENAESMQSNLEYFIENTTPETIEGFENLSTQLPLFPSMVFDIQGMERQGREFIEAFNVPVNNYVFALNFGWAIDTIGVERTRELYDRLGIVNFSRYSIEMLEETYQNITNPNLDSNQPLLVIMYPYRDHNSAFHYSGSELDRLLPGHRVIVAEAFTEAGFYNRLSDIAQNNGRIDTLIAGAHGTPSSLEYGYGEEGEIDLTDAEELARLRELFVEDPTIILDGCSTGADPAGIAAMFSGELNARSFAPTESYAHIRFLLDENGHIDDVLYANLQEFEQNARRFRHGVPVRMR